MKIVEAINKLGELVVIKKWEPIGSVKMFDREQDMSKLYYGTWELTLLERSPIGVNPSSEDPNYQTAGQQFGSKFLQHHEHDGIKWYTQSLSADSGSGAHGISVAVNNGNSGSANNFHTGNVNSSVQTGNSGNIPPSETVYFYKRTA